MIVKFQTVEIMKFKDFAQAYLKEAGKIMIRLMNVGNEDLMKDYKEYKV